MTIVEFHHNAADRTLVTCALIAARLREGHKVAVFAPDPEKADLIDRTLWTFSALSFVPHCRDSAPLKDSTPVVISQSLEDPLGCDVLVNFSDSLPPNPGRFAALIEVVGPDSAERHAARERYKFYRERGHPLSTIDLNEAK